MNKECCFVSKIGNEPTVRKNCSSDWEKLLKFEGNGWEVVKQNAF